MQNPNRRVETREGRYRGVKTWLFDHVGTRCAVVPLVIMAWGPAWAVGQEISCSRLVRSSAVEQLLPTEAGPLRIGLPRNWFVRQDDCPAGIALSSDAVGVYRDMDALGEWDTQYREVLEALVDWSDAVAYAGSSVWGGGSLYSDLHIWLFASPDPLDSVRAAADAFVLPIQPRYAVRGFELTVESEGVWSRIRFRAPLEFFDYGHTAAVDVYSRRCGGQTVSVAFAYADDRAWGHADLVVRIVASIECLD